MCEPIELLCFEKLQCGNYGIGGDYWPHMDRMQLKDSDPKLLDPTFAGDRVATIVNVLQAPQAGILFRIY